MPAMNPKAANLGSRPARSTGESRNNQRIDGDFKEIENKYGDIIDVVYWMGKCRNPECGAIGRIFKAENNRNICLVCMVVQNEGLPEGDGTPVMSNRAKKRANEKLIYDCLHNAI